MEEMEGKNLGNLFGMINNFDQVSYVSDCHIVKSWPRPVVHWLQTLLAPFPQIHLYSLKFSLQYNETSIHLLVWSRMVEMQFWLQNFWVSEKSCVESTEM